MKSYSVWAIIGSVIEEDLSYSRYDFALQRFAELFTQNHYR